MTIQKNSLAQTAQIAIQELSTLADSNRIPQLQRFFKTAPGEYAHGDKFIGITVPNIRKIATKFELLPINEIKNLIQSPIHEHRLLALIILIKQYAKCSQTAQTQHYEFYLNNTQFINNWDLVDTSAPHIIGAYLNNKDHNKLYQLAKSSSLWERRIAIIATFYFIRNNKFNTSLHISKILLNDHHDLIHKAVGWMLREIGKRNLAAETQFLDQHASNMPRTMLRYAIERFSKNKRQHYLNI